MSAPDLIQFFSRLNVAYFDAFLDPPVLRWNSRLRTSAGRFVPGSRRFWREVPPTIEIAAYLLEENDPDALVLDTLGHEMIHYWLWVRRRPYGHTDEFMRKLREMGVSRYNRFPRKRPQKYLYRCGHCGREFRARRKLGVLACLSCCKQHSGGRFDERFRLVLERKLTPAEAVESVPEQRPPAGLG